ncbi:MAG: PP2C family protein-serine/threonine phosphatase, partial [Candidatus Promineifilaceae bacterium]|nr:PP2C family protein-serine/threonine phosphatase [Candidatus Promineifilaceae bacterium]
GACRPLSADGIVLGVLEDVSLQDATIEVAPGDFVVFYTDGVTEAMNEEMEEFGVERLRDAIAGSAGGDANDVLEAIVAAVDAHTGEMPRWDDVTLVVARRLPS